MTEVSLILSCMAIFLAALSLTRRLQWMWIDFRSQQADRVGTRYIVGRIEKTRVIQALTPGEVMAHGPKINSPMHFLRSEYKVHDIRIEPIWNSAPWHPQRWYLTVTYKRDGDE